MKLLGLIVAVLALTGADVSSWVTFNTGGVQIRHPSGWHATARPLTAVAEPKQILSVASFAFPTNRRSNGCRPTGTLVRKQPSGAVIFIIEYQRVPPGHFLTDKRHAFPPRPATLKLRGFANYECFGRSYQLRFREQRRDFQIFVSFGRRATPSTRNTTLRILNSFTVESR